MKDPQLEQLLSELKQNKPTDFQLQKWKNRIQLEVDKKSYVAKNYWFQLVAASLVGFFIGALVMKSFFSSSQNKNVEIDSDNATIEYIITKNN